MLKEDSNFCLVEDGDKYYELVPLYNAWHKRTWLLSTGNTAVPEWKDLVEYCTKNVKETEHFYLDLIDFYSKQKIEGIRSDNFVGFINDIIYECFKNDEKFPQFNSFVGGDVIQKFYKFFVEWDLSGRPKIKLIDKIKRLFS